MELRSRRSLDSKTPAAANTPAPAVVPATTQAPVATSQDQRRASLGRSATEPLSQHMLEEQQNSSIEVKEEVAAPRASALEAFRTSFPIIPTSRAHSTPATLQPQDQAFDILEKKIGNRLSAQEFARYRSLISDRVILVVDDSARRVWNTWKLQEFLKGHPGILLIHNQFARSYNKLNIEIFHLPAFKPPSVQWHGTSATTPAAPANDRVKRIKTSHPSVVTPIVANKMETSKPDDDPGAIQATTRDSNGNNDKESVPKILQLKSPAKRGDEVSMERPDDEQAHSEQHDSDKASTSPSVDESPSGDGAAEHSEQGQNATTPDPPSILSMSEEAQAKALKNVAGERAASPERAQAYLAWLQHRLERSPTVPPNRPECVRVAKKLGRPSPAVHDDVLHYWGLETDSRRGEWFRQNRLHTLGEDPRFDSENMGFWEAWLKQGRDEMEKKASRMDVCGSE